MTSGKLSEELQTHVEHAYKKLERIKEVGAKRGQQEPTLEEIEHARVSATRHFEHKLLTFATVEVNLKPFLLRQSS